MHAWIWFWHFCVVHDFCESGALIVARFFIEINTPHHYNHVLLRQKLNFQCLDELNWNNKVKVIFRSKQCSLLQTDVNIQNLLNSSNLNIYVLTTSTLHRGFKCLLGALHFFHNWKINDDLLYKSSFYYLNIKLLSIINIRQWCNSSTASQTFMAGATVTSWASQVLYKCGEGCRNKDSVIVVNTAIVYQCSSLLLSWANWLGAVALLTMAL